MIDIIDIRERNKNQVPTHRIGEKVKYIVIHYLGVPNADNPDLYGDGYGGHFNITRSGEIYMAADPENDVVWHCGGGKQGYDQGSGIFYGLCTNYNSIGIENSVCFDYKDNMWFFTEETQESLVKLTSYLMDVFNIPIDHVIRHWDVTGKHCPAPYVENTGYKSSWTWEQFIENVKSYRGGNTDEMIAKIFSNVYVKKLYSVSKYRKVVINPDDLLNVRVAPDVTAPNNPAYPKLANGNEVRELLRFSNGWSFIFIDVGKGKSTCGYVSSKHLK